MVPLLVDPASRSQQDSVTAWATVFATTVTSRTLRPPTARRVLGSMSLRGRFRAVARRLRSALLVVLLRLPSHCLPVLGVQVVYR